MLKYEYYLAGGAHHDYATRMIVGANHMCLWQPKWALLWDYEHCSAVFMKHMHVSLFLLLARG